MDRVQEVAPHMFMLIGLKYTQTNSILINYWNQLSVH